jgi:hypothetical protein
MLLTPSTLFSAVNAARYRSLQTLLDVAQCCSIWEC